MTNTDFELLKRISETPGAPGFEKEIRDLVLSEITPLVDEVRIDHIGNVIAIKKSSNPSAKRAMVAAHMDEIGFIVTHIDDKGFVRFHTLGGFDAKTLTAQRVIIHGSKKMVGVMGSKPIHVMTSDEQNKAPKTTDYFIDLGLSKEEVEKHIRVGNPITRERDLIEMGNCYNGKSLDNRISVFVLIQALQRLKGATLDIDLYATFTVQEEVGLRGAQVAAHTIDPHYAIALDTTIAYDVPTAASHEKITELGKGTAIKVMDASTIADYRMVAFLQKTADESGIQWQHEILTAGGTDTAYLQRMGKNGSIAGAISIPTRHIHQVIETVHKHDVEESIKLLVAALSSLHSYDWSH